MKMLIWNARGCSRDGFGSQANYYSNLLQLDLFCILDTRADKEQSRSIASRLYFDNFDCVPATGQCGGLLLCWKARTININIVFKHDRFLHCLVTDLSKSFTWFVTFVYMYPKKGRQPSLFQELLHYKPSNNEPWLVAGDFNNILHTNEKLGGLTATNIYMNRFQNFLNNGQLFSLPASGIPFTWTNNHRDDTIIYERLDRALANPAWMNAFPHTSLENLPIVGSDHGPICLTLNHSKLSSARNFKFEAMWTTHDDFINIVKNAWSNQVTGNAIQQFMSLSNSFKFLARNWNKNVFGDLFTKIKHNHD